MRVVAFLLAVAAIGSLVVSLASHKQRVATGWTMYTPLSNDLPAAQGGARVYEYPNGFQFPTHSEYDGMPWDDARLWLGLAIGFGVAATAVGIASVRGSS